MPGAHRVNMQNDQMLLNYVQIKNRNKEAMARIQEQEKLIDRQMEEDLLRRVEEGEQARRILQALGVQRITAAPHTASQSSSRQGPQRPMASSSSAAPNQTIYPRPSAHNGQASSYPQNVQRQQFMPQNQGQSQVPQPQRQGMASNQNPAFAGSHQVPPHSAPLLPPYNPSGVQFYGQPHPIGAFPYATMPTSGYQMNGAGQQVSYGPTFQGNVPMPVHVPVVGPVQASGGGNYQGAWQPDMTQAGGAGYNYTVPQSQAGVQHVQPPLQAVPPVLQQGNISLSSTLDGALGQETAGSSLPGPSSNTSSPVPSATLQELPPESPVQTMPKASSISQVDLNHVDTSLKDGVSTQPTSSAQLAENSTQSSYSKARESIVQFLKADTGTATDIKSTASRPHMPVPSGSTVIGHHANVDAPQTRPPPSASFASMDDLQERAKRTTVKPYTAGLSGGQSRGPIYTTETPQSGPARPSQHNTEFRAQNAVVNGSPAPRVAAPMQLPYSPHRVFIPPSTPTKRPPTRENLSTPDRPSDSTTQSTPASAKKNTLAKDIMFALGRKRKQRADEEASGAAVLGEPALKKIASSDKEHHVPPTSLNEQNAQHIASVTTSIAIPSFPSLSTSNEQPTPANIDPVAAISAEMAQVGIEVQPGQPSTTVLDDLHPMETPPIAVLADGDDSMGVEEGGATIEELPDNESESTVDLGLIISEPEVEAVAQPRSPTSSSRQSPFFDPIDETVAPLFFPSPEPESDETITVVKPLETEGAGSSKLTPAKGAKVGFKEVLSVEMPPLPPWAGKARSIAELEGESTIQVLHKFAKPVQVVSEEKTQKGRLQVHAAKATTSNVTAPALDTEEQLHRRMLSGLMQRSMSRLRSRPCLWPGCTKTFNTASKLQRHVSDHISIGPDEARGRFPCQWVGCQRDKAFNNKQDLLKHTRNHVARVEHCIVVGCDAHFGHPSELLGHLNESHAGEKHIRPDDKPFHPAPRQHPPDLPLVTPAYAAVPIRVRPFRMTKDRHREIGPRVVKDILGPVNLDVPRLNARYPMRAAQQHQYSAVYGTAPRRHDEFDFLSASPSKPFSDIPSSFVSDIVEANVLMEPIEGGPQGIFEEVVIASEPIPDESQETSGREDEAAEVEADDGGAGDGEPKAEANGEKNGKEALQDADEENAVDDLV